MFNSATLLDAAFRCVDAIGYEKTLDVLNQAQFQEIKFDNKIVEKVVTLVAKKTGVTVYEILFGSGRKNERKYAIGFCAYYLHSSEFFNIEMVEVGALLMRIENSCYKYAKMVTRLKPGYVSDKKFLEIKKELDVELAKESSKSKK